VRAAIEAMPVLLAGICTRRPFSTDGKIWRQSREEYDEDTRADQSKKSDKKIRPHDGHKRDASG
jgi:hypothetical protein